MGEIKQAYILELEQRLSDWHVDMKKLQLRIDSTNVRAEDKPYSKISELRKLSDETKVRLQKLRESDHDDWHDVREGLESAWHSLRDGLNKMASGFKHELDTKD